MNENAIHGAPKKGENGELHKAITTHSSKLEGGGHMNENAIHGAPKKIENGELHYAITTHSSKLEGGGHMNENAIRGDPKRLRIENCTKQSLRIAPNSKLEDT